ncbi:hypothetical protein LTR85_011046 [Meristemomyces frigidus]|nr:hypothetical protein LTR85_011046 [Meristemomyces frigidus]
MVVLADQDVANHTATFKQGRGESNISTSGLMQGELSVVIPGLYEPLRSTWLSVRSGNESSPEQVASNQITSMLHAFAEAPKSEDMTLEEMLARVAQHI